MIGVASRAGSHREPDSTVDSQKNLVSSTTCQPRSADCQPAKGGCRGFGNGLGWESSPLLPAPGTPMTTLACLCLLVLVLGFWKGRRCVQCEVVN